MRNDPVVDFAQIYFAELGGTKGHARSKRGADRQVVSLTKRGPALDATIQVVV